MKIVRFSCVLNTILNKNTRYNINIKRGDGK
nr:MAG TPA: hypothetical protein [Caudoviricetes sp.]